jgi:hypothetical protein
VKEGVEQPLLGTQHRVMSTLNHTSRNLVHGGQYRGGNLEARLSPRRARGQASATTLNLLQSGETRGG